MNKHLFILLLAALVSSGTSGQQQYALVIHGGAGVISKSDMSSEREAAYLAVLDSALETGRVMLEQNKNATEVVVSVIKIMENSPLFNAGKGAVFTHEGINELDASIMNGKTLNAGAVAGVRDIKNPIEAALAVMEKSEHVFLSGEGASEFARLQGLELVPNSYFYTEPRYNSLLRLLDKERESTRNDTMGTVGCVVLDQHGNLAAGTSTGGMTNKKFGRIGDAPVIGAGTYADNNTCAVSCTGHGEYYIRLGFARDISALMEYKQLTVKDACREEIRKLGALKGTGGVIAVDKNGNIAMEFNTSGMFRGYIRSNGKKQVAIYSNEKEP